MFLGALTLLVDKDIVMDVNETKVFHVDGAPSFISAYQFQDFSGEVDVFYLQNPDLESKPSGSPLHLSEEVVVPKDEYIDYAYWLNEGSSIDISFTAKENWQNQGKESKDGSSKASTSVDFYVIKGDSDFNSFTSTWKGGGTSYDYMLYRHSNNDVEIKLHVDVVTADVYYLVFVNEFASTVIVDMNLNVGKTHYLLEDSTPVCGPGAVKAGVAKAGICDIPLVWDETWKVLLRSPFVADTSTPETVSKDDKDAKTTKKAAEVTYQMKASTSIRWVGYLYNALRYVLGVFGFAWFCHRLMVFKLGISRVPNFWDGSVATSNSNYQPIATTSTSSANVELGAITETSAEPVQVAQVVSSYTDTNSSDVNMTLASSVNPEPSAPPSSKM